MIEIMLGKGTDRAMVDDCDADLAQLRWYLKGSYVARNVSVEGKSRTVFLHVLVLTRMGLLQEPGKDVDHVNRNVLDNRRNNLRLATKSQNRANRKGWSKLTPYKGVGFDGRYGPQAWFAYIRVNKRRTSLGYYKTAEEAAHAYDAAAREAFGNYALVNFP